MMPNFFVIGAQKAGTTSLYHYLTQHPQVYMSPVKEPCFFNYEIDPAGVVVESGFGSPGQKGCRFSDIQKYRALFRGARGQRAIGEASPPYIYVPGTAERIERHAPGSKVIALLRNPADRAYSAFLHAVRIGKEPLTDFSRALLEEEERVHANWHYTFHYRSRGFYYTQLERYYKVFGRERVGVWLYEDLRSNPVGVVQDIFRFLSVDDAFVPDTTSKHNPSGVPKGGIARATIRAMDTTASAFLETFTSASKIYPLLSRMRQRIQRQIVAKPPPLDSRLRVDLIGGYREDILELQELIERDLSMWLEDGGQNLIPGVSTAGTSG
jgi:Sulfotransferase domain